MAAKPTQGEWKQDYLGIYSGHTLVGRACWANDCDADIHEQAHSPQSEQEAIANARLMGAAVNLLFSLKELVEAARGEYTPTEGQLEAAILAIELAEGRTE